ncbi:MAG: polysulfide reductase NrfD [Firmicutes bacterium]|nr:polysulfide reductase NrfD [Bacillota bacterium]
MTRNRTLWLAVWGVAMLAGLYGLYLRFTTGHALAGYGSAVPWGLSVALYSFLSSMSAGLYLISTLPVLFGIQSLEPLRRTALWGALGTLAGGLTAIGLDLGQMFRFWEVYTRPNFTSVMALMVWVYTIFVVVIAFQLRAIARQNDRSDKNLTRLGALVAVIMGGGGGALYAVVGSRPFWHSSLLPLLFLVGGMLAGAALLLFVASLQKSREGSSLTALANLVLGLLVLDLIMEWAEFSIGLYGGELAAREAARLVLFGPYAWAFWGLHLLLGTLVPLALLALAPQNRTYSTLSGLLVLATYLTVRLNIVIPGLAIPVLPGLDRAYIEPGLTYNYAPTSMEWLTALFAVALAIAVFEIGRGGGTASRDMAPSVSAARKEA